MAYTYDPYDPEELRRRSLLSPPEEEARPYESSPYEPTEPYADEQEQATGSAAEVPTVQGKISLSPAQQRYKDTLSQLPQRANYKPSGGRKVMAILGGIASGIGNPARGIQVGQHILQTPYAQAMEGWQNSAKETGLEASVEQKAIDEDIARQRASAYGRIATSREEAARATEKFRQHQIDNQPWQPHSEEEYKRVHPQKPTGWLPQTQEQYKDVHPHNPPPNPLALEGVRHANRMQEQAARDNRIAALRRELAKNKKTGSPATPQQQLQAEHLAAQEIIRKDARYASFYDPGDPTKKTPPRIKGIADLPKAGGGMFGGGVTPAQESLSRELYRQFLSDLDKKKKEILGSKNPISSEDDEDDDIVIQQDDEEDDQ